MTSEVSRRKQRYWGCFVCKNLRNALRIDRCSVCNSRREVDRFAFRIEDQSYFCRVETSKSIKTVTIFRIQTEESKVVMLKGGSDELRECVYMTLVGEVTRDHSSGSDENEDIDTFGDGMTASTLTLTTTNTTEVTKVPDLSKRRSSRTLFDQVLENACSLAYDASIGQFVHIDTLKLRADEPDNGLIVRDVNYIKFMTREKEQMGKIVAEVRDRRDHPDESSTASIASSMAKSAAALAEWQGRAPCGLCGYEFPVAQLMGTITNRAVVQWLTNHGVELKSTDARLLQSKMYDNTKLCLFCTQFFDANFGDVFEAERAALARATGEAIDDNTSKVKRKLQKKLSSDESGLHVIEEKLRLEELKHKSKSAAILPPTATGDGLTRAEREERRKEFIKAKRRFKEAAASVSIMVAEELRAGGSVSFQYPPLSHRSGPSEQPTPRNDANEKLRKMKSVMLTELAPSDDEQSIITTIPERGRSKISLPRKARTTHSISRRSVSKQVKSSHSLRRGRSLENSATKSANALPVAMPKRRSASVNSHRPKAYVSPKKLASAQSRRRIVQSKSDRFPRAIVETKSAASKTGGLPADLLVQLPKLKPTPLVLVHADGSKSAVASKALNDTLKRPPPPEIAPNTRPKAPATTIRRLSVKENASLSPSKSDACNQKKAIKDQKKNNLKPIRRDDKPQAKSTKPEWVMPAAMPEPAHRRRSSPQLNQKREKSAEQKHTSKRKKLISLVVDAENAYDKKKAKRRINKGVKKISMESQPKQKTSTKENTMKQPNSEVYADDFELEERSAVKQPLSDDILYASDDFESLHEHPATDDFASLSIHTADDPNLYDNDEFETEELTVRQNCIERVSAGNSVEPREEASEPLPLHQSLKRESPAFIMTTIDADGKYHFQRKSSSPQMRGMSSREGGKMIPIFSMSPPSSAGFGMLYSPPGSSKLRRQADAKETNYLEMLGDDSTGVAMRRGSEGLVRRQSSKNRQLRSTVIGGATRKQEEDAYTDSKLKQRAYQIETSIATRLPEKFAEIKSDIQGKPTSLDIQIMRQAGEVVSKPKKVDPLDAFTKKMNQRRNTRI